MWKPIPLRAQSTLSRTALSTVLGGGGAGKGATALPFLLDARGFPIRADEVDTSLGWHWPSQRTGAEGRMPEIQD